MNGKGKIVVALVGVLQGLLFAGAGFWVSWALTNRDLIEANRNAAIEAHTDYEARLRVLESHYATIKDDIKDIKGALNVK